MKPSPNARCARAVVRDFLVGLAVFLAVFTLAMLDSRASHSAPVVVSKPASISPIEAVALKRNQASRMTPIVALDIAPSLPDDQPLASEDITAPSSENSKLALHSGKPGTGRHAAPGALEAGRRSWTLSVMALMFTAMTALTLGLWRHLRHSVVPRRSGRRV